MCSCFSQDLSIIPQVTGNIDDTRWHIFSLLQRGGGLEVRENQPTVSSVCLGSVFSCTVHHARFFGNRRMGSQDETESTQLCPVSYPLIRRSRSSGYSAPQARFQSPAVKLRLCGSDNRRKKGSNFVRGV